MTFVAEETVCQVIHFLQVMSLSCILGNVGTMFSKGRIKKANIFGSDVLIVFDVFL